MFLWEADFEIEEVEDHRDFSLDLFLACFEEPTEGSRTLGAHLMMGPDANNKSRNFFESIERGHLAPTQIIATRKSY